MSLSLIENINKVVNQVEVNSIYFHESWWLSICECGLNSGYNFSRYILGIAV